MRPRPQARRSSVRLRALVLLMPALMTLAGCSLSPTNFSQRDGFAAFYAAHPRRDVPADAAEQALLQRHRPRFFLPAGHAGLIDFYRDYIAHGTLLAGNGDVVSSAVTPALLNAHRDDARATFTHVPPAPVTPVRGTVYGRVDHDTLVVDGQRHAFTFLTYHAVFRHSGLAAGLTGWRAAALGAIADLDDWHQLDHYTAASVVLDATSRPVALLLQQHNYQHTVAYAPNGAWPADGRIAVDVALRSNELYPHQTGRVSRRAARFGSPQTLRFLMHLGPAPQVSGDDITDPAVEADYALQFLAPTDAFYSFQGFLGTRRRLPGRDGPPGADFNTLPALKPWTSQLLIGFWRVGDRGDLARLDAGYGVSNDPADFVAAQRRPFLEAIGALPPR